MNAPIDPLIRQSKSVRIPPKRKELQMGVLTAVFCYSLVISSPGAVDERASSIFSVNSSNTGTQLNCRPFLVGLRMSNALISHEKTRELIDNMDLFASYGINSFSVFFQGSRFGDIKGYNEDGTLNAVYASRMGQIIEAADARGMVILVGCLYHGNSRGRWDNWKQEDADTAIANTVRWLKEHNYRNVFIDVNRDLCSPPPGSSVRRPTAPTILPAERGPVTTRESCGGWNT